MAATSAKSKERLFTKSYAAIMAANFLQMAGFWFTMPLLPFYLEERFACSEGRIGVVLSLFTAAALAFRPFSGCLLDTFRRKPLYLAAYSVFTAIFAGYIVCATLTTFIVLRLAHGVAFGTQSVGGNTLVVDIMPSSRRGEGLGYYGLTNNMAMSIGPMAGLFMHERFSYEALFAVSLAVCTAGFLSACLIKPKKRSPAAAYDGADGFHGAANGGQACAAGLRQGGAAGNPRKPRLVKLDRFILLQGIPAGVALLLLSIPYGTTTNFVAMYVRQMGIGVEPGLFFTCMAGGMGVSRLFSGKMADRGFITRAIDYGLCLIIAAFTLLASCGLIAGVNAAAACAVFFIVPVLQGVGFGMLFPAYNSLFISLAPHNRRATATSTYLTAWDMGIGIGLAAGGMIAERASFGCVYAVGAVLCAISALLFTKWVTPHFMKHRLE